MPFTFLASCCGLCDPDWGTLSYAFRKGERREHLDRRLLRMGAPRAGDVRVYSLDVADMAVLVHGAG